MNYIKILFAQMSLVIILVGGLLNNLEKHLPIFLSQSFRYGKFALKKSTSRFVSSLEIPKSWFRHFYIFSSIMSSIAMYYLINVYFLNKETPLWLTNFLNVFTGTQRFTTVTPAATLLATFLLTLQCYRRLYDTHFVSVFGKNSKMNFSHYLIGFIHYFGAFVAIFAEAPHFSRTSDNNLKLKFSDITFFELSGVVLFLWAWWHQYKVTIILGNLRKDNKGNVVSEKHQIPEGDLFTYVSSPHLLTEIVMYLALTIILWHNSTWWFVTFWVISNQVETALLSHWWYKETFSDYPEQRKILIPHIF